jgi:hypothetical protein
MQLEELGKLKKSNDLIGNLTRHLPACNIVPQPTTQRVSQSTFPLFWNKKVGLYYHFAVCVSVYPHLYLPGNGSVNTLLRQKNTYATIRVVFCAAHVVWKESRWSVLPRIFFVKLEDYLIWFLTYLCIENIYLRNKIKCKSWSNFLWILSERVLLWFIWRCSLSHRMLAWQMHVEWKGFGRKRLWPMEVLSPYLSGATG